MRMKIFLSRTKNFKNTLVGTYLKCAIPTRVFFASVDLKGVRENEIQSGEKAFDFLYSSNPHPSRGRS